MHAIRDHADSNFVLDAARHNQICSVAIILAYALSRIHGEQCKVMVTKDQIGAKDDGMVVLQ